MLDIAENAVDIFALGSRSISSDMQSDLSFQTSLHGYRANNRLLPDLSIDKKYACLLCISYGRVGYRLMQ